MAALSGYVSFIVFTLVCIVGGLVKWDRESKYKEVNK